MTLAELVLRPDTGPILVTSGLLYGFALAALWTWRR